MSEREKPFLKANLRRWALTPLVAIVIVILDQWSKGWIEANVPLYGGFAPIPALEPYLRIVHLTNTGAAFGLLRGQGSLFVVIGLVVIVAILAYVRYLSTSNWLVRLCLGLQLGGAIGNLVDRVQLGHVTDFLLVMLPLNDRVLEWPAFNVADSAVVGGVIGLAILMLFTPDETPETVPAKGTEPLAARPLEERLHD